MSAGLITLLVVAIADQTSPHFVPAYQAIRTEFESDARFVKQIETSLPEGAMIFQLPYVPFPENGPVHSMNDYDLFRGYLHSSKLRWSYGAMRGREGDRWQRMVASKPVHELVDAVVLAGFSGIYIDRYGFQGDSEASLEKELSLLLSTSPLISDNGRLAFFGMEPYTKVLRGQVSEKDWQARKAILLTPVLAEWKGGFSVQEGDAETWRWCSSQGEMHLINPTSMQRKILLEMTLQTGHQEASNLEISGDTFTESLTITSDGRRFLKELVLPPGDHLVSFRSDAERINAPGDLRVLVFRVNNFRLHDIP
jgi:phosphoglycerol transferase